MQQNLDRLLDDQTGPNGEALKGLISARQETLQSNIDDIDDRIESLEFRLEGFEQQLITQFAALEETMSSLNAQQGFLGSLNSGQ
ncbi:MAG: flagellar filament capping protein FliD [Planctomycetota bacterium]